MRAKRKNCKRTEMRGKLPRLKEYRIGIAIAGRCIKFKKRKVQKQTQV